MILLGTILLEPNRWRRALPPAVRVSAWLDRFRGAGFDGLELWEPHYLAAEEAERERLAASGLVHVHNTYARFDGPDPAPVTGALADALRLGARAIKFNVGPPPGLPELARERLHAATTAHPQLRLRWECHPGTWLETPAAAAAFLRDLPAVEIILHAFREPADALAPWWDTLGPRVTEVHAHVRRADGSWSGLAREVATVERVARTLRRSGFRGDWVLEFTHGTSSEADHPEALWNEALADLAVLRSALAAAS